MRSKSNHRLELENTTINLNDELTDGVCPGFILATCAQPRHSDSETAVKVTKNREDDPLCWGTQRDP